MTDFESQPNTPDLISGPVLHKVNRKSDQVNLILGTEWVTCDS